VIVIDRYHELVQVFMHTYAEIGFRCSTLREIEEIITSPRCTTIQKSAWCTTTQKSGFGALPFNKKQKLLQVQAHYHSEIGLVYYHSRIGALPLHGRVVCGWTCNNFVCFSSGSPPNADFWTELHRGCDRYRTFMRVATHHRSEIGFRCTDDRVRGTIRQ
jgi:hypothetical protein